VYDLGLKLFLQMVIQNSKVSGRLTRVLLNWVERERGGEMINRGVFKNMIQMLVDLGIGSRTVYESEFEKDFLKVSAKFYRGESQLYINTNTVSDYMKKVEARLREESERVGVYLDLQTDVKIKDVLDKELISAHQTTLVEMGVMPMMAGDALSDLSCMYRLLARVRGGLDLLRLHAASYVEATGKELVTAEMEKTKESYNEFVRSLLGLKDRMDMIVNESFGRDKLFHKDISKAFEKFVNVNDRTPQFLSLFVDEQLTKGLKGLSDEEVDRVLNSVVSLFRYLADKDVFEKYYKQHLSKRLLNNNSVSEDSERLMIAKLKMECGFQFTSKLEGMFQDIHMNQESSMEFQNWLSGSANLELPVGLEVQVLTTTYWPIPRSTLEGTAILPQLLTQCTEIYTKFYLSRHDGRKLTFQPGLGDIELRATVGKTRRVISCSPYQAIILLLMSDPPSLTYQEILTQSGISENDMKRHLLAMTSSSKKDYRVLCKTGDKKTLEKSDEFTVNASWKPKLKHIKLGLMGASKARDKEAEETNKKILEERKINIDATIVRVMKSRKKLEHKALINEVIMILAVRFSPKPAMIKKQIESLISREYLERCEGGSSYNYLA
jgi:cullin 3